MKVKSILENFLGMALVLSALLIIIALSALRIGSTTPDQAEEYDQSKSRLFAGPNTPRCDCL